jgi:hypothetical protein
MGNPVSMHMSPGQAHDWKHPLDVIGIQERVTTTTANAKRLYVTCRCHPIPL